MPDEEKEFIKKINIDKAKNKTIVPILLIIISLLTYVLPLIYGEFDFGIFFEVISFFFLLLSRSYMTKYDVDRSKRYVICSMLAIGWLLVYDIIFLISSIQDIVDFTFLGFDYVFFEILSLLYLASLFRINKALSKADNPIKYKESTDWFYEKQEKNEHGSNSKE